MANPNNSNHLAEYDDTNLAALPGYDYGNDDSGEIISLCRIFTDKFENRWLSRCADLNTYGNYEIFYQDKNEPPYFRNRSKLYYNFFEIVIQLLMLDSMAYGPGLRRAETRMKQRIFSL